MSEHLDFKKGGEEGRLRKIVRDFYEWQKAHPGEDKEDPEAAALLLKKIEKWQRRDDLSEEEARMYGFEIAALRQGILRVAPVKNSSSEDREALE